MSRYIRNDTPDLVGFLSTEVAAQIRRELHAMIQFLLEQYPPSADYQLDSLGNQKNRYSIYSASGGNLYLYYNLFTKYDEDYKEALQEALSVNIHSCKNDQHPNISFLSGRSGIYSLAAVLTHKTKYINSLASEECLVQDSESELLFGLAGYLYSILFVLDRWKDAPMQQNLIAIINRTGNELIRRGNNNGILKYEWPLGRGKRYLGAAHGTTGILMMLLQSRKYFETNYDQIIINTLSYLLNLRFPSGNFRSSEGKIKDHLVHFCHGATGAVPMLCQAYSAFNDESYLNAAIQAGNVIWERGLIKKGKGICHGISGNGYAFLSLYRYTDNDLWLHRALFFADKMLNDQNLNREISNYTDSQRLAVGLPDRPYSLMEGLSGNILFYVDLLNPKESKFPVYEI